MTAQGDPPWSVRVADPDDAGVVAALGARLFEQTFAADNDPDDLDAYLATAFATEIQALELADPAYRTWLAHDAGATPVGYAMVRRGKAGDGVVAERPVELQRIYVDRSMHGGGLGAELMALSLAYAAEAGCDVVWLGVWERNHRAIAFYEKQGFAQVGEHTFLLGSDPQRDVVLARRM